MILKLYKTAYVFRPNFVVKKRLFLLANNYILVSLIYRKVRQTVSKVRERWSLWNIVGFFQKSELFFKFLCKLFRQYHISYTQWRWYRFWKRVHIYNIIVCWVAEQRFFRFSGYGKFRFKVVFNYVSFSFFCPFQVFVPFWCRCRNTTWVTSVRGDMQYVCCAFL